MKKTLLLLPFISFFIGCNQSATSVFKKDPIYGQNVQYTKILKVINKKNNVEAIANITYLNSVNNSKYNNGKQNFLVGIYTDENNSTNYTLTLNNAKYIDTKEITKQNPIYKNIAFRNNWANYFIYTFENTKQKSLELKYSNSKVGFSSVSFVKE